MVGESLPLAGAVEAVADPDDEAEAAEASGASVEGCLADLKYLEELRPSSRGRTGNRPAVSRSVAGPGTD